MGGDYVPGVTKHIYDHEIRDIQDEWSKQLSSISKVLPKEYDKEDVVKLLKKYYPHEWHSVEFKKNYYDIKDKHIKKHKGKSRYNMPGPECLLEFNPVFKHIISSQVRKQHMDNYSDEQWSYETEKLWNKRENKIKRINEKIEKATSKTQMVTPDFLDVLIGLYSRKNTSQKDKVYIINELMKYYNSKVINFFFKVNDTELNRQLREMAFKHLQSFNFQPRLRRQKYMQVHTKNKKRKEYLKKIYPNLTYSIPFNPEELEYRLELGKEQKIKKFKYFVSHSSSDAKTVQKLIDYENKQNNLVFCDWINDSDYLKRHLLCESTLKVIEWRLKQSEAMIFVRSQKSLESVWCKYELNYFHSLGGKIYVIDKENLDNGDFEFVIYNEKEYLDERYKQLVIIEKEKN